MGANVSSKWNPTLHENVPAEEEKRFLLVSFAIDSKCDFFGSKVANKCFASFLPWVLVNLARWSLKLGVCRSMRLSRESSRCSWQTFVSPKSCFPAVSVAGPEFCAERRAVTQQALELYFSWTGCISVWSYGGRFSSPCWQASCCHEQNLLLMAIEIPLPFMCFSCDIWKYYSGNLLPSGPPAASTPALLMLPCLSQQWAHLFPWSCPLQTLFLGLSAASPTAISLWILVSRLSQPINVMEAFSTCNQCSVSTPCHEVKTTPAAF